MRYWEFVFTDLIKELHLGLDFVPVSQTQISQIADPALLSVGSRSWRLYNLWDAWQEVEALTHCGLALPGNTVPELQAPHLEGQWDMCRHHCMWYDCAHLSCLLPFLWSPHKIGWGPVACHSSAYAMNSGFPLQALCNLFSFPEKQWCGKQPKKGYNHYTSA